MQQSKDDKAGDELAPGTCLAHYRIESLIGEGAMGKVYLARDLGLDRPVALKVLRTGVGEDQEFVQRFVTEARAAAKVAHPNLTHIYFVGDQDGLHFFTMEFVEGRDLEAVVAEGGRLRIEQAIDIAIQVARGLGVAHRAGVVHRDVKPSNIILQEDGLVRITDFGLAKSLDAEVSSTRAGQVIGSPTYMSPEQCRGRSVDGRCDTYALGLTTWFLLAGREPYDTQAIGELINDHINTPLPALENLRADVPAGLDSVLTRLSAKDPEKRPQSMEAAVTLLQPFHGRKILRAPLATRALAAITDLVILVSLGSLIQDLVERFLDIPAPSESFVGGIVISAAFIAYHLAFEARWQQTPGKWLFHIQVVTPHGAPPPKRALLPRFALRYPLAILGLFGLDEINALFSNAAEIAQGLAVVLGIVFFLSARGVSFSDRLTRTRVAMRLLPGTEEEEDDEGDASRKARGPTDTPTLRP